MKRLNPYSIGETPNLNPCEKCLIKACCSEQCDDRLRWNMANVKPPSIKIRLSKRKKRRKNVM